MALSPYFQIRTAPIGGHVLGFARPEHSATGLGLFLQPASAGVSALENPIVIPNAQDVAAMCPRHWQGATERTGGQFWHVSKPATDSCYFDTVPYLDYPSCTLSDKQGNRIAKLYAKPCRIDPALVAMGVHFEPVNYCGYRFTDYYVRRDAPTGPGFYIFGRNSEKYGPDGYVSLVARPAGYPRHSCNYNNAIVPGWRKRSDAQAIADYLNSLHHD